mgnify:CR=1 FL=1
MPPLAAFEAFFARYRGQVYATAYAVLGDRPLSPGAGPLRGLLHALRASGCGCAASSTRVMRAPDRDAVGPFFGLWQWDRSLLSEGR